MSVAPALELRGIRKRFGATEALRGVSLAVAPGEVHALIGENGAGKSTLMKVLSGAHHPDAGEMALAGRPYRPAGPPDARRRGVAMIYQELTLAPHLSVRENILLGLEPSRAGWIDVAAARAAARDALAQLGHGELDLERPAGAFGIAERQIIEIARALVGRPGVLILDEPTSSLTGADTERLFAVIARLRDQGVSIIYISHFLEECRRLCDRYTVLKDGASVGSGWMAETTPDALVTLMTGREVRDLYPRNARAPGAPLLEVQALAGGPRLRGADCVVRAGEIFGLAGLVGAGRTELLRAVFGLDPRNAGGVRFGGEDAAARPRGCWAQGVGFLSEDRKEEGLLLSQPLGDNLTLTKLGAFSRAGWIDAGRQTAAVARWIEALRIRCLGPDQPVGQLSGGNQQKVALARLLEHPARILLLDEPTRGIDVGSKAEIYALIGDLAAAGKAVVVASSHLPELLGLCDTIGVMCRGSLVAVRPRAEWSEAELLRVSTGAAAPSS